VLGRVFCSHACPLGALIDLGDLLVAPRPRAVHNRRRFRGLRPVKYAVLVGLIVAAICGANLLGYLDPLVLFTRFATAVVHPAIAQRTAQQAWVTGAILALILLLSRLQPRFWCRHLCPLGALLGMVSWRAPYRRRVGASCGSCPRCAGCCPMGAIDARTSQSDRSECITCLACVRECPQSSVSFGFRDPPPVAEQPGPRLTRRAFVGGGVSGLAVGLVIRPGTVEAARVLRPPGALPEAELLRRCVRCGACLRACPTNILQPARHESGALGMWVPEVRLRRDVCREDCNLCGQVCPTEAIRPLSLVEKTHARIGTPVVDATRCLGHGCRICEDHCPYGAITTHRGMPVVDLRRCNGCGRCEQSCPVEGSAAIRVTPEGALRLSHGSYVAACAAQGIAIVPADPTARGWRHRGRPH
jgi:ferredoxin-type protein NapF